MKIVKIGLKKRPVTYKYGVVGWVAFWWRQCSYMSPLKTGSQKPLKKSAVQDSTLNYSPKYAKQMQ